MAEYSRFVDSAPHRWHVQEAGEGPVTLLLHGAGGATQSWRGLFPILKQTRRVIAIDLPGQGFTRLGNRQRCGLANMATDIEALCQQENWTPNLIVGHSAGAALALQMTLNAPSTQVVGINAALGKFEGVAGWLFPALAKVLALTPFIPDLFASTASSPTAIRRLIEGTGSDIDRAGLDLYRRLITNRDHVDATLTMMAQWDLTPLLRTLPKHRGKVTLIAGANDKTVPPQVSKQASEKLAGSSFHLLDGVGHLAHEEDPSRVAQIIEDES
ncbi:alpha/beta fold hydrolase BchO [Aestuariibius insulae]|uniref:alpha/beta fold hydrolase BchO n=1 Tax=Aestuariibius insulae TaxID=2058287 RepID=UPI00398E5477